LSSSTPFSTFGGLTLFSYSKSLWNLTG